MSVLKKSIRFCLMLLLQKLQNHVNQFEISL